MRYMEKRFMKKSSWCEKFYNPSYIERLSAKTKNITHEKIKAVSMYNRSIPLEIKRVIERNNYRKIHLCFILISV